MCWRRSSTACCVLEGGGVICDGSQFVQWPPLHHSFNSVQFAANHRAQQALLQTSIILLPTLKDLSFLRNQSLLVPSLCTAFRFSLLHGDNHSNKFFKHRKICKLLVFSQEQRLQLWHVELIMKICNNAKTSCYRNTDHFSWSIKHQNDSFGRGVNNVCKARKSYVVNYLSI